MLFLCKKAREVWRRLGLDEIIHRACEVDHAGEAVLEFLLLLPDQDLSMMEIQNCHDWLVFVVGKT